jgi:uncharacterized protein
MAHGQFFWNELMTRDVETAKAFYAATLGWNYRPMPMMEGGTYWLATADAKPIGGIMDMTGLLPDSIPAHWMSYVEVADLDACLEKLKAGGGTICREPFEVPDVGRIAIVADPTGAVIGWITPWAA